MEKIPFPMQLHTALNVNVIPSSMLEIHQIRTRHEKRCAPKTNYYWYLSIGCTSFLYYRFPVLSAEVIEHQIAHGDTQII